MTARFFSLLIFFLSAIATAEAISCELEQSTAVGLNAETVLYYRFTPSAPPVGEHFSIDVLLCRQGKDVQIDQLKVDAVMPAHSHGMNYRPEVLATENGQYRVEGLLFHMPGHWQILLDISINESRYKPVIDQYL